MRIRRADGDEMLRLWGYPDAEHAAPTAVYFYENIKAGNALFWTIDHDGELIGELYAFLDIREDRDFADGKDTAYLCAFRIRKDYRHRGLGTMLMETVLADLKSRGFRNVTIGADDEQNEQMYRHMGYTEKIRECHYDPCAMDENMRPVYDEKSWALLLKRL